MVESAKDLLSGGASSDPNDPDQRGMAEAIERVKAAMFLTKEGFWFTQARWGESPVPYQMAGLKLVPLPEGEFSMADAAVSIDRRVVYEFRVAKYRVHREKSGWGKWVEGMPPGLDPVTLVRQRGEWKVESAPLKAYSLR